MKKIKYFLWLIIIIIIGILIYQNLDYFMAKNALTFNLKISSLQWTTPELQNIVFFAICFLTGLILAGIKSLIKTFKFKREIKTRNAAIYSLQEQNKDLKTKLDVFENDPYIKPALEEPKQDSTKESTAI